jgi:hypothetical protein
MPFRPVLAALHLGLHNLSEALFLAYLSAVCYLELNTGKIRNAKFLHKVAAHLPPGQRKAQRLQAEADSALAEAEALKLQARIEDLNVWEMGKVKETKKGSKTYTYWMASWREGEKVLNVHLGSCAKMGAEEARKKAVRMKAAALTIKL